MTIRIRGTERADTVIQGSRAELDIRTFGGNDQIKLDRDDDLGGNNFVDAGEGRDTVVNFFEDGNRIVLGGGNDTYVGTGFSFFNVGDVVNGGAGNDQFFVQTLLSTYQGGSGNDIFFTDGQKNDFLGGTGTDTISYQFRHENSIIGDEGVTIDLASGLAQTGSNSFEQLVSIENAIGSLNADAIGGTDGNNALFGLAGDDDMFGFGGADRLVGGLGSDLMFGGTGADRFIFATTNESPLGRSDIIGDFSRAEGDRIDLSAIDAKTGIANDQAFNFIGNTAFTGAAGELRFSGGFLQADTDGNRVADLSISVEDVASLVAGDFLL